MKQLRDGLVHCRMAGTEHPIQLAAAPSRDDVDSDLQSGADSDKGFERHRAKLAALDPRDRRRRDAGLCRDIRLPPAAPETDGTESGSNTQMVHPAIVEAPDYQP